MATDTNFIKPKFNKQNIRIGVIVTIILIIEIGSILMAYYFLKKNDTDKIENIMMANNEKIIGSISEKLQVIKYTLARNAAFFRIHGIYLSAKEYADFIQTNQSVTKNIVETYIWILKLSNNSLDTFVNFCHNNILPNCSIKQLDETKLPNITFTNVRKSEYYYPLIYLEPPFNPLAHQMLVGFDLYTNNITAAVIDYMLSQPTFSATYRVPFVSKPENNPYSYGILLNYPSLSPSPFFKEDDNNLTTKNINGIASSVVKLGHLFNEAINSIDIRLKREDIDMIAFDVTEDGYANNILYNISLLYKENKKEYAHIWSEIDINISNAMKYNYDISGRRWLFYFIYSSYFKEKQTSNLLIIIPSVMAAIFILINIIIFVVYKFINSLKQKTEIESNKSKIATQMLGYVNHEIRNPLNVIKGLVDYTLENMIELDKNMEKYINSNTCDNHTGIKIVKIEKPIYDTFVSDLYTVSGSCNMLEHIVTDILDIQKLDSGKLVLNNKNININEFIKDLVKTVSQKIDEKQTITMNTIYNKTLVLYFDPFRLKQILLNYLTNAIKYTNHGSITIKIEENNDTYRFSIIDTGRGIPDGAKNRIFQPFNQTSPEDASRYGGIGLGLHLCKTLANRMDGKVGFESEYKVGSTFWVEFPKSIIKPKIQILEV